MCTRSRCSVLRKTNDRPLRLLSPLLFGALLVSACAKAPQPMSVRTALSEAGASPKAGVVALPFLVAVKHRNDGKVVSWTDPALTDRLAALLLEHGYTLLDRSKVKRFLGERGWTAADIEREDDLEALAQALGAEVVVLSRLVLVEAKDGRMFDKKFSVRAVRLKDGHVLFSLSAVDTTPFRHLTPEVLMDAGLDALRETSTTSTGKPSESADTAR